MRQDPTLCFLARCGPPDGAALLAELNMNDDDLDDRPILIDRVDKEEVKDEFDDIEPLSPAPYAVEAFAQPGVLAEGQYYTNKVYNPAPISMELVEPGKFPFPSATDLNTRLRRIITGYQRNHKKEEIKLAQRARRMERQERFEQAIREKELKKRELQQRWSRREEADFYRTISSFGVDRRHGRRYNWARFRAIARLERKFDDTLTEYFKAFYAMCKRVCGKKLLLEEEHLPLMVEPISEERASRCLQRIDLLNSIRDVILLHPELDERLKLCQPSMDLPDWWQCGKHDKDLLIGAARHGLSRMDFHLLHDPDLSFKDVLKSQPIGKPLQTESHVSTPAGGASPLVSVGSADEDKEVVKEEEKDEKPIKVEFPFPVKNDTPVEIQLENDASVTSQIVTLEKIKVEEVKVKDEVVMDNHISKEVSCKPEAPDVTGIASGVVDVIAKVENVPKVEVNTQECVDTREEEVKHEKLTEPKEEPITEVEEVKFQAVRVDQDEDTIVDSEQPEVDHVEEKPDEKELLVSKIDTHDFDQEKMIKEETESEAVDTAVIKGEIEASKDQVPLDESQEIGGQNDEVLSQESFSLEAEPGEPTVAQLLAHSTRNPIRWPKDKVLQIRLEHICHAVEKNEWPIVRHTFLHNFPIMALSGGTGGSAVAVAMSSTPTPAGSASPCPASPVASTSSQCASGDTTPQATPEHTPVREASLPDIHISTSGFSSSGGGSPLHPVNDGTRRRRRRRRRFEIEAERAKLRVLLSHSLQQQQQLQHSFLAPPPPPSLLRPTLRVEEHSSFAEEKTLATAAATTQPPSSSSSAPPPAHQNSAPRMSSLLGSLDLRVKSSSPQVQPMVNNLAPASLDAGGSPSSPMDLSSGSVPLAPVPFVAAPCSPGSRRARGVSSLLNGTSRGRGRGRGRGRWGGRGGSRIDALALDLQARKQQQILEEQQRQQQQHHPGQDLLLQKQLAQPCRSSEGKETVKQVLQQLKFHNEKKPESLSLEPKNLPLPRTRGPSSDESGRHLRSRNMSLGLSSAATASLPHLHDAERLGIGSLHKELSKTTEGMSGSSLSLSEQAAALRHDVKKWLDDHPELVSANPNLAAAAAAAMAFNPLSSISPHTELLELPEGRRRGRRPRIDPTKLDYDKLTGEENVSVINRLTGKKITGNKAPPLKYLAEWLEKNPMFDVDPKWGQLVKERGNLPDSLQKRITIPSEKRGGRRTAAAMLANAHQSISSPPTTMTFPSTSSLNPLSFANAGMLTGFPSMKFFMDPSKGSTSSTSTSSSSATTSAPPPPIFLPFGGLAGMGLANPLFGFPGFGFQGLPGVGSLGTSSSLSSEKDQQGSKDGEKTKSSEKTGSIPMSRTKSSSSSSASVTVSSPSVTSVSGAASSLTSSLTSATSLPFLYPTPSLLYNPLGLGGFTLPPNMSTSFASLAQAGLVNGLGGVTSSTVGAASTTGNLSLPTTAPVSLTGSLAVGSCATTSTTATTRTRPSAGVPIGTSGSRPVSAIASTANSSMPDPDSDDESLKSLMGNQEDDDDDDLDDDDKLDTAESLDRDDSESEDILDTHFSKDAKSSSMKTMPRKSEKPSEMLTRTTGGNAVTVKKHNSDTSFLTAKADVNKPTGNEDPTSESTDIVAEEEKPS